MLCSSDLHARRTKKTLVHRLRIEPIGLKLSYFWDWNTTLSVDYGYKEHVNLILTAYEQMRETISRSHLGDSERSTCMR